MSQLLRLALELSLFVATDIIFCHSQVANMEINIAKNGKNNETYLQKMLTNDETNTW